MKRIIALLITLLTLAGCSWSAKYNPDFSDKPTDKATVVFYFKPHRSLFPPSGSIPIVANDIELGELSGGEVLTTYLKPATYKIHTASFAIDRISTFSFEADKVYFIKIWVDHGMWVGSIRLTQTSKPEEI